jgi:hypothetical protein
LDPQTLTGEIGRANLDASGLDQSFISGLTDPAGIAVDGAHIYWTEFNPATQTAEIGRANLDGWREAHRQRNLVPIIPEDSSPSAGGAQLRLDRMGKLVMACI